MLLVLRERGHSQRTNYDKKPIVYPDLRNDLIINLILIKLYQKNKNRGVLAWKMNAIRFLQIAL